MKRWHWLLVFMAGIILGILCPPVKYIGSAQGTEWPIACVEITFANGDHQAIPPGCDAVNTPTPWPTFTPTNTPGWAPTATAMGTPVPTVTLTASTTPTATPSPPQVETTTPIPAATPTLESTPLPTATPGPTAIPKSCQLRSVTNMRVRTDHTTAANNIINIWPEGDQRTFDQFWQADETGYLWGHHKDGWSAIYYWPTFEWFVAGTAEADLCRDVDGWPWNLAPPDPIASEIRSGPHILMGEGASVVQNFAADLTAAKCLPGSYQICLALKTANPGIYIIARPFTDRLATQYDFDPLAAWQAVAAAVPTGFDALELENESTPPDEDIPRWVQFSIGLAGLVARDTGMQYLAFSFGPGNPPYEVWPQLVPYFEWVAAHPLPDGRYHGIAIHAAPYATFDRPDMPWVNDLHVAGRIYLARDVLLANTGFDLAAWPGVIAVTEIGLSDGYSGNWDAPYSCAEAADAYQTTRSTYTERGYPQVFTWWNFGKIGIWTSDHDCAQAMFGK